MDKSPKQFDVWFVTANTVYKQVPYQVVADWVQQGRLGKEDMVRAAGSIDWKHVEQFQDLRDYLPRRTLPRAIPKPAPAPASTSVAASPTAPVAAPVPVEPIEFEPEHVSFRRKEPADDDVDMIPLIDISIVLLVFFILIRASGSLANVPVPDTTYTGYATADPEAITISIEPDAHETVRYSIRIGDKPAAPDDAHISSAAGVFVRLGPALEAHRRLHDERQKLSTQPLPYNPPMVRIACHKELPSRLVFDLVPELRELKNKSKIGGFTAEVKEVSRQ